MSENLIYTDRDQPIDEALATMTDRWIESSEYCQQTVIDLRDRLREHRDSLTKLVEEWRLSAGSLDMSATESASRFDNETAGVMAEKADCLKDCADQLQALIK